MAAARLIVAEAGGVTADPLTGGPLDFTSGRVLAAATPMLLAHFLETVRA
jgi:fructose-1,6-bisphosphatase/inositol monophosphatase family enzyme